MTFYSLHTKYFQNIYPFTFPPDFYGFYYRFFEIFFERYHGNDDPSLVVPLGIAFERLFLKKIYFSTIPPVFFNGCDMVCKIFFGKTENRGSHMV